MFPLTVVSAMDVAHGEEVRTIILNRALTVIVGPNGGGKTHLLRGLRKGLASSAAGKKVRYLSAGRAWHLEEYRSDYDGHRGHRARYDEARFGTSHDVNRRHNYETLQGDFQTLAVRPDILIKIRERLQKLFARDIYFEWDSAGLRIYFSRTSGNQASYSSGREASGLLHLVGLLAALYDDEVGAILIDEPEVSLHPQLQAFVLREMISVAGTPDENTNKKIVVLATHSPEFVLMRTPLDVPSLIFCADVKAEPLQIRSDF
jgi:predicted ATP-dependent endonuclease of OLD family